MILSLICLVFSDLKSILLLKAKSYSAIFPHFLLIKRPPKMDVSKTLSWRKPWKWETSSNKDIFHSFYVLYNRYEGRPYQSYAAPFHRFVFKLENMQSAENSWLCVMKYVFLNKESKIELFMGTTDKHLVVYAHVMK